ncbi:hypothetical protein LCGC14_1355960 [marine sediment metagenome]|uniref:Ribbon-helix-helix protein CopG domain-containing protein n=1 Tax=marine sediment metagenome TaxID=412755 RepID=A0A0F9MPZ5_9ZZZZ
MNEKRDKIIGIRFTAKENEFIKDFAEKRNNSLTELIREAVFSHINNIINSKKIDLDSLFTSFIDIKNATRIINKTIEKAKKMLDFKI